MTKYKIILIPDEEDRLSDWSSLTSWIDESMMPGVVTGELEYDLLGVERALQEQFDNNEERHHFLEMMGMKLGAILMQMILQSIRNTNPQPQTQGDTSVN